MYFMINVMYFGVPQGYDTYDYVVFGKANAERRFEAEKADHDVVHVTMHECYVNAEGIVTQGNLIKEYEAEEEM